VAEDVIVMLPETAVAAVGVNEVEKLTAAPAAIVCPMLFPLALKPDPVVVVTWLIVIVAFPVFVRLTVWALLLPTETLPKLTLPGFAPSVLPLAAVLPVKLKVCGEFPALSLKTTLPVDPVVDVGAYWTLSVACCPALIVTGNERPLIPKPVPDSVAELILRFELPLFVIVTL
jgi:hypothetical protein